MQGIRLSTMGCKGKSTRFNFGKKRRIRKIFSSREGILPLERSICGSIRAFFRSFARTRRTTIKCDHESSPLSIGNRIRPPAGQARSRKRHEGKRN